MLIQRLMSLFLNNIFDTVTRSDFSCHCVCSYKIPLTAIVLIFSLCDILDRNRLRVLLFSSL
jgi:hypothetical protein